MKSNPYTLSTVLTYAGMLLGVIMILLAATGCAVVYPQVNFVGTYDERTMDKIEEEVKETVEWFAAQREVDHKHFANCLQVYIHKGPFRDPMFPYKLSGLQKPCEIHVSWHARVPDNALIHELWHWWDWLGNIHRAHHPEDFNEEVKLDKETWRMMR